MLFNQNMQQFYHESFRFSKNHLSVHAYLVELSNSCRYCLLSEKELNVQLCSDQQHN